MLLVTYSKHCVPKHMGLDEGITPWDLNIRIPRRKLPIYPCTLVCTTNLAEMKPDTFWRKNVSKNYQPLFSRGSEKVPRPIVFKREGGAACSGNLNLMQRERSKKRGKPYFVLMIYSIV